MQCKKRYFLAAVVLASVFLAGYLSLWSLSGQNEDRTKYRLQPRSYFGERDHGLEQDIHVSTRQRREVDPPTARPAAKNQQRDCRMETCFDFSRCQHSFKVYVYPTKNRISSKYEEILKAIRESRYFTNDPSEACILVPSIDTLDRDKLSKDYVPDIDSQIYNLPHWNQGQNHIVFNLYAGTWPDYGEDDYGFSLGQAMLAQASMSDFHYRPGFDISFPLFHKELSFKGGEPGFLKSNNVPPVREYTLAFKGKRYLTGIGSETRNSLYHIHNDKDIILLTTCKHGKGWENMVDERCEKDNEEYDKYDYKMLLHKSTFCLVPRGRRLGSYRFLETLQAACLPVVLANNWVLPFSEVIDWNRAVIWGDERLLLQVPSIVRGISHADILLLRQQNQLLWDTYFSSIDKIIDTTLEILKDRIHHHMSRSSFVWNSAPGSLNTLPEYSQNLAAYPFYQRQLASDMGDQFTAVIYATGTTTSSSSSLYRLLRNISRSRSLHKVLILWHSDKKLPPPDTRWPVPSNIPIIHKKISSLSSRFYPFDEVETNAVLSLDAEAVLLTDEVDFAFHVWQHFPTQIIGYIARSHYWDDGAGRWLYSSKWNNDYSMVLLTSAFYHRYYAYMYTHWLSSGVQTFVDQAQNCEDILLNFLVSHVTKLPPIKLTQHKYLVEPAPGGASEAELPAPAANLRWASPEHFYMRQQCLTRFFQEFGYMTLIHTSLRFDPHLYKDPVSKTRKKYRQIDIIA